MRGNDQGFSEAAWVQHETEVVYLSISEKDSLEDMDKKSFIGRLYLLNRGAARLWRRSKTSSIQGPAFAQSDLLTDKF